MGCHINQNQINSDTVPCPTFLTYSLKLSLFAAPFDKKRNAIFSHPQSTVKMAIFDQIRPLYSLVRIPSSNGDILILKFYGYLVLLW